MSKSFQISAALVVALAFLMTGCINNIGQGFIQANTNIAPNCTPLVNFQGDEVYGYRNDDVFFVPSIQTGGFSTISSELGVNLFASSGAGLTTGNYSITSGSNAAGTGYLFYLPDKNNLDDQWISIAGSNLVIAVKDLKLEFNENTGLDEVVEYAWEIVGDLQITSNLTGDTCCIRNLQCDNNGYF